MTNTPILSTVEDVEALATELAQQTEIAVDLEADSLHSYREQVCLLQVSWGKKTVLIDPLPLPHLDPLKPVLANPDITKIFHAADYDIRSLYRDFDIEINGLFDTMVSSQFAGEEKWGLADQLNRHFGLELDKKYQRADWSKRPLSKEMIAYAAGDTAHLFRLKEVLQTTLADLGRLDWVAEEFALLEKVRMPDTDGPKFLRFKGAGKLDRRQLAVLEALLQWRDAQARHRDCPLFKIVGNKALLEIAQKRPQNRRALETVATLSPRLQNRYGKALLEMVQKAEAMSEEDLPTFPRPPRREKDPAAEDRLLALKRWRVNAAKRLALDPGVLINNATLELLARENPADRAALEATCALKRWQFKVLGDDLLQALD